MLTAQEARNKAVESRNNVSKINLDRIIARIQDNIRSAINKSLFSVDVDILNEELIFIDLDDVCKYFTSLNYKISYTDMIAREQKQRNYFRVDTIRINIGKTFHVEW